jgi:parvulin-like peptidyl-prolyl isomerase
MKKIENIEKSLSILSKMNFPLTILVVVQMLLKVIPRIEINDNMEYQTIIAIMSEQVLNLPDYIKINHIAISMTFSLLQTIAEGITEDMIDQDLSYAYALSSQLTRHETSDQKAFKVLSNYRV